MTAGEIQEDRLLEITHRYSFENLSNRESGQEDASSFLRKGIVGDWKEKFSQDSKELFAESPGKTLIELGYEEDDSWVGEK